jgi:hypothetical protein
VNKTIKLLAADRLKYLADAEQAALAVGYLSHYFHTLRRANESEDVRNALKILHSAVFTALALGRGALLELIVLNEPGLQFPTDTTDKLETFREWAVEEFHLNNPEIEWKA